MTTDEQPDLFVDEEDARSYRSQAELDRIEAINATQRKRIAQREKTGEVYDSPANALNALELLGKYQSSRGEYDPRADQEKVGAGPNAAEAELAQTLPMLRPSNPFKGTIDRFITDAVKKSDVGHYGKFNAFNYDPSYWQVPDTKTPYGIALGRALNWEFAISKQKEKALKMRSRGEAEADPESPEAKARCRGNSSNGDPAAGGLNPSNREGRAQAAERLKMSKKYHISPSGKISICRATVRACPYQEADHFVVPMGASSSPEAVIDRAKDFSQQKTKNVGSIISASRALPNSIPSSLNPTKLVDAIAKTEGTNGFFNELLVDTDLQAPDQSAIRIQRAIEATAMGQYRSQAYWKLSPRRKNVPQPKSSAWTFDEENTFKFHDSMTLAEITEFIDANRREGGAFSKIPPDAYYDWRDNSAVEILKLAKLVEAEADREDPNRATYSHVQIEEPFIRRENDGTVSVSALWDRDGFRSQQLEAVRPGEQIGLFELEDDESDQNGAGSWRLSHVPHQDGYRWVLTTRGSRGETQETNVNNAQDVDSALDSFYENQLSIDFGEDPKSRIDRRLKQEDEIAKILGQDARLEAQRAELERNNRELAEEEAHRQAFREAPSNQPDSRTNNKTFGKIFKLLR